MQRRLDGLPLLRVADEAAAEVLVHVLDGLVHPVVNLGGDPDEGADRQLEAGVILLEGLGEGGLGGVEAGLGGEVGGDVGPGRLEVGDGVPVEVGLLLLFLLVLSSGDVFFLLAAVSALEASRVGGLGRKEEAGGVLGSSAAGQRGQGIVHVAAVGLEEAGEVVEGAGAATNSITAAAQHGEIVVVVGGGRGRRGGGDGASSSNGLLRLPAAAATPRLGAAAAAGGPLAGSRGGFGGLGRPLGHGCSRFGLLGR